MAVTAQLELVGREAELDQVREFLAQSTGAPRAFVIRGEAGIGKTALWRAAVVSEEARRFTALTARCVEGELPLGLGGLSDLVQNVFPETVGLADQDHAALAVAIGLEQPQEMPREAIALPRAFLALLRLLARQRPVLVTVDDVQWLDVPSARIVSFAARRLSDMPVAFLVTQRDGEGDPLDLTRTFGDGLEEIRLGPLDLAALAHLVRSRLSLRLPGPALARVREASGGNPMFALEFARATVVRDGSALGPAPVPASLQELVRARLDGLPRDVQRLLAIAAACDHPTPTLLGEVEPAAGGSLAEAVDAGVVVVDDGVVRFTHPLLAAAAYASFPPSKRRTMHARLAETTEDVEGSARHLALAQYEPDAIVAATLDAAARHALARGAPEAAVELAQEALRLTPSDATEVVTRKLLVAEYLGVAGPPEAAAEWIDRLLASGLTGTPRARALMLRFWVGHDIDAARPLLDEAAEHAGDDPSLRAQLLLMRSSYLTYLDDPDLGASEQAAREALAIAERAGDRRLVGAALATVADRLDLAGQPDDALIARAIRLESTHGFHRAFRPAQERHAMMLLRRGDLRGARGLLEVVLDRMLQAGAIGLRCRVLTDLFDVEWRSGNWQLAQRYLDHAWDLGVEDIDDPWMKAELPVKEARLAALQGEVAKARGLAARGIECAEAIHSTGFAALSRWALGFLELSLGQPARAWESLADAPTSRAPVLSSLERLEAVSDGVEALVGLARLDDACELLKILSDEASRGNHWAAPAAERGTALVLIARGEVDAAVAAADKAAEGFAAAGFPFERGRALLVAGDALRRFGKRSHAAEQIEAAQATFVELGAALWVERTETELRRARPRPRRDRELTNAERQVAALVASGLKNREVAARQFTTEATVEKHLTRIYRKLGVRSRAELARRVADGSLSLADK